MYLFEIYVVSQNSMNDTFQNGDHVLIRKNIDNIKLYDVLIFNHNENKYIKRCLGLPGDTIQIVNGIYFLNGKLKFSFLQQPNSNKGYFFDVTIKSIIGHTYGKNWTPINFGPYIIPKKGFKILMSIENINLYRSIINSEQLYDEIYLNKNRKFNKYYFFTNDYIFLVGDNYLQSIDSREFGPIKKDNIVGKVLF
jgi:signal peptidase I